MELLYIVSEFVLELGEAFVLSVVPAGYVGPDALLGSAEELVNRLAFDLALYIPAGDVDGCEDLCVEPGGS